MPVARHQGGETEPNEAARATLADVLYAGRRAPVSERDWAALVEAIAAGDQGALHALFERSNRPVFTLALRITGSRETAEEVTLDVFHDVWHRAAGYDPANGTVLGWIMNQARSRAIDRLRFDQRAKRVNPYPHDAASESTSRHVSEQVERHLQQQEQRQVLQEALTSLTTQEQEAIETAFFSELSYAQAASRLNEPLGTIKTRIRSGLQKLRQAFEARRP